MKRLYLVGLMCAFGMLAACQTSPASSEMTRFQSPATIFLVRHAEKSTDKDDPALTTQGRQRAERLADLLKDAGITSVYSTDYSRTRDTAAPMAKHLGVEIKIYDGSDLNALADRLKTTDGRALVVGHSNTTPELTELLGGEGGEPIIEATEYNRLYIVSLGNNGEASTILLRYGD